MPLETERNGLTQTLSLIDNLLTTSGFAASRVQSEAYMYCRPPILAPSALGNRPPVQNWIEEEQGSIILRSGTVSEAPYIRIATPKIRIPPKPSR